MQAYHTKESVIATTGSICACASYRAFQIPGSIPSLASFLNVILESPVAESTALGLPVMTQRMRMRVADVLLGISASARCAACRTVHGNRLDMMIDFNTMRVGSAAANMRRRTTSIATLPIVQRLEHGGSWISLTKGLERECWRGGGGDDGGRWIDQRQLSTCRDQVCMNLGLEPVLAHKV